MIEMIFKKVLDSSFRVHTALGPGLLENTYEECLFYELKTSGIFVEKQKALSLIYMDVKLETGYRIDLLVEKQIIVEIIAIEAFTDVHFAQILTYLRLSKCTLGLLINRPSVHFDNRK